MNGHGEVSKLGVDWASTAPAATRAVKPTQVSSQPCPRRRRPGAPPRSKRCATAWPGRATCPTRPRRSSPSSPTSSASPCWSRARRASARPSWRRRCRAGRSAGSCACSATRASTRPRRCTSGTTASSCCASRPRRPAPAWQDVQEDIFSEDFLMARPLLTAISVEEPVVLLIDEIDKTDQEFEAMLLEVLSDFQISIPELGVVEATTQPARAAHLQQHPRADRGAEAPLPVPVARLSRTPSASSRSCGCTCPSCRRRSRAG